MVELIRVLASGMAFVAGISLLGYGMASSEMRDVTAVFFISGLVALGAYAVELERRRKGRWGR